LSDLSILFEQSNKPTELLRQRTMSRGKGWNDVASAYDPPLGWETRMAAESMSTETALLLDLYLASHCPESQHNQPYKCVKVAGMAVAPWFIDGLQRKTDGVSLGDRLLDACGGYMLDATPHRDGRGLVPGADKMFKAINRACLDRVYDRRSATATGPAYQACVLSRDELLRPLGRGLLQTMCAEEDETVGNSAFYMRGLFRYHGGTKEQKDIASRGVSLKKTPIWSASFLGSKYVQPLNGQVPAAWHCPTGDGSDMNVEPTPLNAVRTAEAYVGLFAIAQLAAALRLSASVKSRVLARVNTGTFGEMRDNVLTGLKGRTFPLKGGDIIFQFASELPGRSLSIRDAGIAEQGSPGGGTVHGQPYDLVFFGDVSVRVKFGVPDTVEAMGLEMRQWLEDNWARCDIRVQFVEQPRAGVDPGNMGHMNQWHDAITTVPDVRFSGGGFHEAATWEQTVEKHYADAIVGSTLHFIVSKTTLRVPKPWDTAIIASSMDGTPNPKPYGATENVTDHVCLMHSMHGMAVGRVPLCAAAVLLSERWWAPPAEHAASILVLKEGST